MDVLVRIKRLDHVLVAGNVRQHPQLDLRVVGVHQHRSRSRRVKKARRRLPSSVRTGMFCRFGSVELMPPGAGIGLVEVGVDAPVPARPP